MKALCPMVATLDHAASRTDRRADFFVHLRLLCSGTPDSSGGLTASRA